jgi:Mn-dependent DtxR family transcriptional regulator
VSGNEIARRVGVASSTVRLTLKRLAVAGLEHDPFRPKRNPH